MLLNISCSRQITEPIENQYVPSDNVSPGSRDYVWTADTIFTQNGDMLFLDRIWGSSPNDIWAVGSGDSSDHLIWHYNGTKWTTDYVHRTLSSIDALFGLSANDVWIGDDEGDIWHYIGGWNKVAKLAPPGFDRYVLVMDIWGTNPNDIYAAGWATKSDGYFRASLWKYNGTKWDSMEVPEMRLGFSQIRIQHETGKMLLAGYCSDEPWTYYLFTRDQSGLKKLYEGSTYTQLVTLNDKVLIGMERKMYYFDGQQLKFWRDFSGIFPYNHFFARSTKDIISASPEGIIHWNGTDVKLLYKGAYNYGTAAVFDKDFFILSRDTYLSSGTGYNIIIHGKLKDN
jgi:hypothetical protein